MITIFAHRSFGRSVLMPSVLTFALSLFGAAGSAQAGSAVNNTFIGDGWAAIGGYDPVAYFTMGEPVEGSKEFTHEWLAVTWRFANAEHRDLFVGTPIKYAPQYGGYCSRGLSGGSTDSVDPTVWRIVDGKLYLFYGEGSAGRWERDIAGEIAAGDAHWKTIEASLSQ